MSNKKYTNSGLRGLVRLIADATIGITGLVEAVHSRIVHPPFMPSTPIQHLITHIAGFTFRNIRSGTQMISGVVDNTLVQIPAVDGQMESSEQGEAMRAVLNGVMGDTLERDENPLAISMHFRYQTKAIPLDRKSLENADRAINGKILLMVHGLCMNDIQWTREGHNHGQILAGKLNKTPIYLRYNSGRHISTNGQNLSELCEELVLNWPVPVEEIVIIAHSMGGLVARSAHYYGKQQRKSWTKYLRKIIFLATPHHGATLERAGNYLHAILEGIHYTKPFARLGSIRSAGVTDLRYGNLLDEDWQDNDRFKMHGDQRQSILLPDQVECYSIAGAIGKKTDSVSTRLLGDNLVTVNSAMGKHKKPSKDLQFKKGNTLIAFENNHLDLLSNPEICDKIRTWMQ